MTQNKIDSSVENCVSTTTSTSVAPASASSASLTTSSTMTFKEEVSTGALKVSQIDVKFSFSDITTPERTAASGLEGRGFKTSIFPQKSVTRWLATSGD